MKTSYTKTAKGMLLLTMVFFLLIGNLNAQKNVSHFQKNKIENLVNGINSDNEGLKRNSIYFAGKYKVEETVNELVNLLKKEKDAANKILIALSLYQIGNQKGLEAVKNESIEETDERVKVMCGHIYTQYLKENKLSVLESK